MTRTFHCDSGVIQSFSHSSLRMGRVFPAGNHMPCMEFDAARSRAQTRGVNRLLSSRTQKGDPPRTHKKFKLLDFKAITGNFSLRFGGHLIIS